MEWARILATEIITAADRVMEVDLVMVMEVDLVMLMAVDLAIAVGLEQPVALRVVLLCLLVPLFVASNLSRAPAFAILIAQGLEIVAQTMLSTVEC